MAKKTTNPQGETAPESVEPTMTAPEVLTTEGEASQPEPQPGDPDPDGEIKLETESSAQQLISVTARLHVRLVSTEDRVNQLADILHDLTGKRV